MLLIKLFLCILFCFTTLLSFKIPENNNLNKLLTDTLKIIFRDIYKTTNMNVRLILNATNSLILNYINDELDETLKANNDIQIPVAISKNYFDKISRNYFHAYIIIPENLQQVQYIVQQLIATNELEGLNAKYLILHHYEGNTNEQKMIQSMHKMMKFFFNLVITNINVITYNATTLNIHTYYPFTLTKCWEVDLRLLKKMNEPPKRLSYHFFYPLKVINLYKCPVSVILYNLPPYMELIEKTNDNGSTIVEYNGYDALILKDMAKAMNFIIKPMKNEPSDYIGGHIYKNNTAIGSLKMLINNRGNLTIGDAICSTKRSEFLSTSVPYFIEVYVIVLQNQPKPTIELFLQPFQISTWVFLITGIILKIFCDTYIFSIRHRLIDSFANLFHLMILYVSFLLKSSYEGSLFQIMHDAAYKSLPKTINEIIEENYTVLTDMNTAAILDDLPHLMDVTKIVANSPLHTLEIFVSNASSHNRKIGVLSPLTYVTYFMTQHLHELSNYALVHEPVFVGLNCIYFPRYTFLKKTMDHYLVKFQLHGFLSGYTKLFNFENAPIKTSKMAKQPDQSVLLPLNLTFFELIFQGLGVLEAFALLVFILECLSFHKITLKKMFNKLM